MIFSRLALLFCGCFVVGCGSQSGPSNQVDETIREKITPVSSARDGGTSLEKRAASLIRGHRSQRRAALKFDRRLHRVARARARDMAQRGYFNHVDPDGYGPNYHVTRSGYQLPASWGGARKANYLESILGGPKNSDTAIAAFLNSRAHRKHILGRDSFYRGHTRYGMGHYYSKNAPFRHYWVFISAPPEGS